MKHEATGGYFKGDGKAMKARLLGAAALRSVVITSVASCYRRYLMTRIGTLVKALGIVATLLLFSVAPSAAVPLVDLGIHTFDPNTGLYWLDPNQSHNRSYNDMLGKLGPGQEFDGYRYASVDEVSTLFANAGITAPYAGPPNAEFPNYQALMALLGPTLVSNIDGYHLLLGLTGTPAVCALCFDEWQRVATLLVETTGTLRAGQVATFGPDEAAHRDDAFLQMGSFLVRGSLAPVPLPGALPLFATGLGALGLLTWRRKRKKAAVSAAA